LERAITTKWKLHAAELSMSENSMKVAILTSTFSQFSGIDRVVKGQASELIKGGAEVTILALEADLEPPENAKLEILGMPEGIFWQRIYRLIFPLDLVKTIRWGRKLRNFDLVVSHQYPMNWLAFLAKRFYRVRYVYYNHGIILPQLFPGFGQRLYMRLFNLMSNWTIKKADSAISISKSSQEELRKETGLDSELIYDKVDGSRFHQGIDSSEIRGKHNLGDVPVVLYVGRISPSKAVHLLIEAFNLVKQKIPETKLIIVGKHTFHDYTRKLKQMSDDSVIFAGYVSDEELPYYYAACDIYATATLWEGFDLPVAEAQACGKPVVAFDIGPHREIIDSRGVLVDDVAEFATAITDLLERT